MARRLAAVRARIAEAGGDLDRVRVVAVTKGFGPDAVLAALAAGLCDLGENYAAELLAKAEGLGADAGRPGRLSGTSWVRSSATRWRISLRWSGCGRAWPGSPKGRAIARFAPGAGVLVQVDTTGLPGRNGCAPGGGPGAGEPPATSWDSTSGAS